MTSTLTRSTATLGVDSVRDYLRAIGRTPLLTAEQEYQLGARIAQGVLAQQRLDEIGSTAVELTADERRALHRTAADGRRATDHMVRANLRLVVSIAKHYPIPAGWSLLDLIQEGTLGLMRAVQKFDHERGLKLSTYATWWIKQAIGRALSDQSRTIRIPVHVVDVLNRVLRTERTLSQQLGRDATTEEIAAEVELTPEKVRELKRHAREPISLHLPVGEDGELGALLADRAPGPSETVTESALRGQLAKALRTLPEREAQVIALRYGLDGHEARTLEEIGRLFGVSRERVRQIEAKAMQKLRQPGRSSLLADLLG
ncbi:sigma-70 family RNA polymerase sigma factor [Nocardia uniformis]|uniref:RNA polymerase sigma factor n=1 Tax=Nocardia uniformis TaxID=53432 RepID=A0A849CJI1_9NOCA|nr:sigma-70 family RNA polymerase sigma factor [Nocardia uniformis]NNH74601.1 sigma-70 family RNA polymerase sigma factor [Nocardia uniformis]